MTSDIRLAIHELGHAFDGAVGRHRGGDQNDGVRADMIGKMGNCENGDNCLGRNSYKDLLSGEHYGFAGDQGVWQFTLSASLHTPGEVFADMVLGWVFDSWGSDARGPIRENYMNGVMEKDYLGMFFVTK